MKIKIIILLCGLLLPTAASASVTIGHSNTAALSSGLVGYWTFDGSKTNWTTNTTQDLSGNGNTGTLVSMSTTTSPVAGKIGQAFNFPGVTGGGAGPVIASAINIVGNQFRFTSSFTVAFWVKASINSGSVYRGLIGTSDGATASGWDIGLNTSTGKVRETLRGTALLDNSGNFGPDLRDGKWHHVVLVNTLTSIQEYIEGVLVGTTNGTWAPATNSAPLVIGNRGPNTAGTYGSIDDVRIYNRALSAQEVAQLYTQGGGVIAHSNTVSLSSGLVGYWTLDGAKTNWNTNTTADSSGNGNTGTLIQIATSTASTSGPVAGKVGQALKFNGASSFVTLGNPTSLQVNQGTLVAWIKTSDAGSSYRGIITKDGYGMYLFGNVFGAFDNGTALFRSTGMNLADNKWHQVVEVFNSGVTNGTTLYIDGVLSLTTTLTITTQVGNAVIGTGQNNGTQTFGGTIDDARIYNRMVSAQEVAQLYKQGGGTIAQSNTISLSSGLVGYWTLDGAKTNWTTNTTLDSSSNGNTGTFINIATSSKFATTSGPVAGKVGQALLFNGSNSKITYGSNVSALKFGTGSFSISTWVKPVNKPSGFSPALFGVGTTVTTSRYTLDIDYFGTPGSNRLLGFIADDNGNTAINNPAQTIPSNQWSYVTMVVDRSGNTMAIYINGIKSSSINISTVIGVISPQGVALSGGVINGSTDFLQGSVDDTRVYNRALSAQEVAQLYAAGK